MRALLESKMISNDTTDFARFAIELCVSKLLSHSSRISHFHYSAHKSEAQQKEILRVLDNR